VRTVFLCFVVLQTYDHYGVTLSAVPFFKFLKLQTQNTANQDIAQKNGFHYHNLGEFCKQLIPVEDSIFPARRRNTKIDESKGVIRHKRKGSYKDVLGPQRQHWNMHAMRRITNARAVVVPYGPPHTNQKPEGLVGISTTQGSLISSRRKRYDLLLFMCHDREPDVSLSLLLTKACSIILSSINNSAFCLS